MKRKNWREWLADYFQFSVRERWAVLILIGLVFLVRWLPSWLPATLPVLATNSPPSVDSVQVQQVLAPLPLSPKRNVQADGPSKDEVPVSTPRIELFPFNPNSISVDDWMKLGLDRRMAERIGRYREIGGRFRKPEDIRKIYGLSASLAGQLLP